MKKNEKESDDQRLLKAILEFVREPLDESKAKRLGVLCSSALGQGFYYSPNDICPTIEGRKNLDPLERAIQVQRGLQEFIKTFRKTGFSYVNVETRVRLGTCISDMQPVAFEFYDLEEEGPNGLCSILAVLMRSCGAKALRICPHCGKYFPVLKSRRQKYCVDLCRFRYREKILTDEEKEARRKLRQGQYADKKKENGGKK